MPERKRAIASFLLQMVLYLSIVTFALYQFKRHTAPLPIYFPSAQTALKAGDEQAARKEFDEALRRRPTDPEAYFSVVQACSEQNKPALVIEYLLRAIAACKQQPADVRFRFYRALSVAYNQTEHSPHQQHAIAAAEQALDLVPDDHLMENEYGYLLADNATGRGPDVDTALAVIKKALDGNKNGPTSLDEAQIGAEFRAITEDSYGWAQYKNEQYPDAVTTLTQALEDYPEGVSREDMKATYYHLGMAFAKLGKRDQAVNAFNSSLAYDAKYDEALTALAGLGKPESNKGASPASQTAAVPAVPGPDSNHLPANDAGKDKKK